MCYFKETFSLAAMRWLIEFPIFSFLISFLLLGGCLGRALSPPSPPPDMVLVLHGGFIMGSNKVDTEQAGAEFGSARPWYLDEHPEHSADLPDFFIDRLEVTNGLYKRFIDATQARPPRFWTERNFPKGRENHPVTGVSWYEADHYCRWAGKRLPTEAEWEKAARGADGREFPWGNVFDPKKANTGASGFGAPLPVGSLPEGVSPYGVLDMAGNAWEWVEDWYRPYPGSDYKSPLFGQKEKVFRGGGYGGPGGHYALPLFYRAAYRSSIPPEEAYLDLGFRCAKSP
jgi:formylglycine-generating enzyme required for sulfatase activity